MNSCCRYRKNFEINAGAQLRDHLIYLIGDINSKIRQEFESYEYQPICSTDRINRILHTVLTHDVHQYFWICKSIMELICASGCMRWMVTVTERMNPDRKNVITFDIFESVRPSLEDWSNIVGQLTMTFNDFHAKVVVLHEVPFSHRA